MLCISNLMVVLVRVIQRIKTHRIHIHAHRNERGRDNEVGGIDLF